MIGDTIEITYNEYKCEQWTIRHKTYETFRNSAEVRADRSRMQRFSNIDKAAKYIVDMSGAIPIDTKYMKVLLKFIKGNDNKILTFHCRDQYDK